MPQLWDFVDVHDMDSRLAVELRYAGSRHPFGEPMYTLDEAFLRRAVAIRLAWANALLRPSGLRINVWDAYRPLSVQARMWRVRPDPEYIAPPSRGSHHNRGAAVDVTLVDAFGKDVEMPTDFDDFSPSARSDATGPAAAVLHREMLRRAMLAAGFLGIKSEWWHFVDPFWRAYPLSDVSLHQLSALCRTNPRVGSSRCSAAEDT